MASYPYGSNYPGSSGPAPGAPPGSYFSGQQQAGGQYGPHSGQYGGPPPGSPYGGPQPSAPYGTSAAGGQYGNQAPGAPYGAPPPGGHFGTPAQGGQYGPSAPGAPYGSAPSAGPYGSAPSAGPYGSAPSAGPYGSAPSAGPYGSAPSAGPYGRPAPGGPYGGQPYGIPQQGPYGSGAPSAGVPAGVDPEAYSWFQSVDADRSGYISLKELKQALVNGNWSTFNDDTCYMLLNMFDKNKLGKIDVYGFSALWGFLQQWRNMFQQFDQDRSGTINPQELHQALSQMGYNLSPQFVQFLTTRYAPRTAQSTIQLDSFIQICTRLQSITDAFKEKDTSRTGNVRISYEDFLILTVSCML